jgi:hypothetical protein
MIIGHLVTKGRNYLLWRNVPKNPPRLKMDILFIPTPRCVASRGAFVPVEIPRALTTLIIYYAIHLRN